MTLDKLKLAFIGGGINSAVGYAHYCASHLDGQFELVAGAFSKSPEVNQHTGERYGVDRTYSCWRTMLDNEADKIDAVVILTPTPAHEEMVMACMDIELPVICEKAVTMTSESCHKIMTHQQQTNSFVAVTYNYSGYPMIRELKELIEQDKLGKISHIQIEMPQEGFARLLANEQKPTPQEWRLCDEEIPTIYLDLAVHLHHLVYFTTNLKPLSTIAMQSSYGWFEGVVDDVSAMVEYEDNVRCQYWFSKSSLGHRNGLRIKVYGTKASAEWLQVNPELLTLDHINGRKEVIERGSDCLVAEDLRYNRFKAGHPSGFIEAFANLYSDFANEIQLRKSGQSTSITKDYGLEVSHQGLKLLEAMVQSDKTRKWEDI